MTGSDPFLSFLLRLDVDDEQSEPKSGELISEESESSEMFPDPAAYEPIQDS